MAYDKGQAGEITVLANGQYEVASWREEGIAYYVDLPLNTCTCEHFRKRLVGTGQSCKHLTQCRAERFERLAAKAKALPQTELEALLPKYEATQQFDIAIAIRSEIQARQQAEIRDAQLKAIFA